MKKLLLLSFTVIASLSVSLAQTIYTADNNPGAIGGANTFTGPTALTDAIAAATAGDIIHVVRSSTDYGTITIDKQLSIFGIGLNPDTDGNERSIVSTVLIDDPVASGTRISGLRITNQLGLGGTTGVLSNLLIENSRIRWIQHLSVNTTLSNIIIRNNVIGSGFTTTEEKIDLLAGAISNIIIANNVLYVSTFPHGVITARNGTSIENNLFIGNGIGSASLYYAFENFNGNSVKNNIFFLLRPHAIGSFNNNTFENNITYNTAADAFSTANGNISQNNIEAQDPLMTNVPFGGSIDYSTFDPTLLGGSPAIGSGEGGTDMGVFGGPAPMKLSGTLIPLIQSLTLPSMILKGTDLPVQIKAEGN